MKFGRAPTTKQNLSDMRQGCRIRRALPSKDIRLLPVVETKQAVRAYWDDRPCGEGLTRAPRGSHEYFAAIEEAKNRLEPYVHSFAAFTAAHGLEVLEIGCGVGTDTVRFARSGARVTAIDLSETAVALTAERLADEGLEGAVREADAESLPFADGSFDLVYSWGVLHHTPDTARAIGEVERVLRPSGQARIMLYNSRSFFAAGVWARAMFRSRRAMSAAEALATGLESPGTKAYTRNEVTALFKPFRTVEIETVATPYDRRVAGLVARALPPLGWNHLVRARP
jgi:ubiquinone/menaquinone biosynthesis C-methylase UbiE